MCLAVPGKVVEWLNRKPLFEAARVSFEGVTRECQMTCVPEAEVGDYVVVHAGIAISRINTQEADRILAELQRVMDNEE